MLNKHKLIFRIIKIGLFLEGIRKGKKVYTYSDSRGKYKFIQGVIENISGESIHDDKFEYTIDIRWDEPLQGDNPDYYIWGAYDYKSFQEKIRFKPKYKIGESVLYMRGSDKEPQWREMKINSFNIYAANESSEHIPVLCNNDFSRTQIRP